MQVLQDTLLEALGIRVVLFFAAIRDRAIDEFLGFVQPAGPIEVRIDRRMVGDVLAVINRGRFDFFDGIVDFVDGGLFLLVEFAAAGALFNQGAGGTQVGQRVQIVRVLTRSVCFQGRGGKQDDYS